jgi:hypothetical protein
MEKDPAQAPLPAVVIVISILIVGWFVLSLLVCRGFLSGVPGLDFDFCILFR